MKGGNLTSLTAIDLISSQSLALFTAKISTISPFG
jgi:hypothetical protein